MKQVFLLLFLVNCVDNNCFSQQAADWCKTTGSADSITTMPMVNTQQPVIIICVDFKDGRLSNGSFPTQDSDTSASGLNIDAVGSMGYVKIIDSIGQTKYKKKIRKYTYDDYWDMVFSISEYDSAAHPDYFSHQDYVPDTNEVWIRQSYDLTVYGSVRDYWNEVSYGNLQITPLQFRTIWSGKYNTGIVNNVDTANSKKYIRWIKLDSVKSKYGKDSPLLDPLIAVKDRVRYLHDSLSSDNPDHIAFDIDTLSNYIKIVVIAAGGGLGGWAGNVAAQSCIISEKDEVPTRNWHQGVMFGGIVEITHELGHCFGFGHYVSGSHELMHWGGFADRRYHFCPPHINPKSKIQKGWVSLSNVLKIKSDTNNVSLPATTSSTPKVALITIYGDAGRDTNFEHSEYLLVEYRKREKFNRFAGGPNATSFTGGALIWHYSNYTTFPIDGQVVDLNLGLKVPNYDSTYRGKNDSTNQLFYPSNPTLDTTSSLSVNSKSASKFRTGIRLTNFAYDGNNIKFNVGYTRGVVPVWNHFLTSNISGATLSGNIYFHDGYLTNTTIQQGSVIQIAPNKPLQMDSVVADASSGTQIKFKSVIAHFDSNLIDQASKIELLLNHRSTLKNCKISNLKVGVHINTPTVPMTLDNVVFSKCDTSLYLYGASGTYPFPILTNNTFSKMIIKARNLTSTDFYIWSFGNTQDFIIPSSATVEIYPNVHFLLGTSSDVISYGKILTYGTSTRPIRFYSITDSPNSWGNIVFDGNGADYSNLNYCKIERGGEVQCLNGADVFIQNSNFRKMNRAVYFNNSAPWILGNNIDSMSVHAIEGTTNYQDVSLYWNRIKRGYSTRSYAGYLIAGTNGNIIEDTVDGFAVGMFFNGGSSPHFIQGNEYNPNPNNKITNNNTGVEVAWGSGPDLGDNDDYVAGNNSIYDNTNYNIYARNSSSVWAENNFFGCGSPDNYAEGGSYIYTDAILPEDPFGEEGCHESIVEFPKDDAIKLQSLTLAGLKNGETGRQLIGENTIKSKETNAQLSTQLSSLKNEMRVGLRLKKMKMFPEAVEHFKAMYSSNKLAIASLGQLTTLYNDSIDFGVYDFIMEQKDVPTEYQTFIKRIAAKLSHRRDGFKSAAQLYNEIIAQSPESEEAKDAWFQKFHAALFEEKDEEKSSTFLEEIKSHYSGEEVVSAQYHFDHANFVNDANISEMSVNKPTVQMKQHQIVTKQPLQFELSTNYPNPFNPTTTIAYTIPEASIVNLTIYDNLGREISKLVNGYKPEGKYEVAFDGTKYASGVYYYKIIAGKNRAVRKMLLTK